MKRTATSLFLLVTALQANAIAAPLYQLTNLGTLPGGNGSQAYAVNDNGQVVGMSDVGVQNVPNGYDHAFRYASATMSDLETLGGSFSQAQGVNNSGVIVGYSTTSAGSTDAFVYSGGTMTDLGVGAANAVNSAGQIVGYVGPSNQTQAFLYNNGSTTVLPSLPGGMDSGAYAINATGEIVGYSAIAGNSNYHAVLYVNGTPNDLGTLPGDANSFAYGINDSGEVVGFSQNDSGVYQAFVYSNGIMDGLGSLGLGCSQAYGINDSGWIVGRAGIANGFSGYSQAFLDIGGTMYDLDDLLNSSGAGWTLESAQAINSDGSIVGFGLAPDGQIDAILLTPVPEPSALVLIAIGVAILLVMAATRQASNGRGNRTRSTFRRALTIRPRQRGADNGKLVLQT